MKTHRGCSCVICQHPEKTAINDAIERGVTYRAILEQYGGPGFNSLSSISRHKNGCMKGKAKRAQDDLDQKEIDEGLDILRCAAEIYKEAMRDHEEARGFAKAARSARDYASAASCMASACKVLELLKDDKPDGENAKQDSGFMKGYMARAEQFYASPTG